MSGKPNFIALLYSFAHRLLTILAVIGFVLVLAFQVASAHDPGGMSARDIAVEQAIAEAQAQRDDIVGSPASAQQLKDEASSIVASMFAWSAKNALTVCFWPNPDQNAAVTDTAEETEIVTIASKWTTNAAIDFQFYSGAALNECKDHGSADIRVTLHHMDRKFYSSLDPVDFDWSRYGKQSTQNPAAVSLSLVNAHQAFLIDDKAYFHFNVAHEFGHALGLMHEHQRIDCSQWLADDATIMKVYQFKSADDLKTFKENFAKIPTTNAYYKPVAYSSFDLMSVMMYNFPGGIWKNVPNNPCLRKTDVEYPDADDLNGIISIYGSRKGPQISSAQPTKQPASPPVAPAAAPAAAPPLAPSGGAAQQGAAHDVLMRIDAQKQVLNTEIQRTQQAASKIIASGSAQVQRDFNESRVFPQGQLQGRLGDVLKGDTWKFPNTAGSEFDGKNNKPSKSICMDVQAIGGRGCVVFSTNDQGGAGASEVQMRAADHVREVKANIDRLERIRAATTRALELGAQ